jgi:hypothetical protein
MIILGTALTTSDEFHALYLKGGKSPRRQAIVVAVELYRGYTPGKVRSKVSLVNEG